MTKLVIHVGYPKAASTSLQNGLFLRLHRERAIHFLGRAWESNFYGIKKSKLEYKKWFNHVIHEGTYEKDNLGYLSNKSINLLSEGMFMQRERFNEEIIGPEKLYNYFNKSTNSIKIIIVFRKQADLIPSYFIQTYRRQPIKRFSEFLNYHIADKWAGEGKIFNFYSVMMKYCKVFGEENVHALLFEDFVNNKEKFSRDMANALDVPYDIVKKNIGGEDLNKMRTEGEKVVVRKLDTKTFRGSVFEKIDKYSPALADLIRIRIPKITEEEKSIIFSEFSYSNLNFAEKFDIDLNIMKKYEYF